MDSTYKPKYVLIKQRINNLTKEESQNNERLLNHRKEIRLLKSEINNLLDFFRTNNCNEYFNFDSSDSSDLFYDSELDQENQASLSKQQTEASNGGYNDNKQDFNSSLIDNTKKRRQTKKRESRVDAKHVEPLPLDNNGKLVLPIVVGKGNDEVTILNIGRVICDREAYHTQRYIWPVGFKSQKLYASIKLPGKKCVYTNEIIENGNTPIFQVTNNEDPDTKYVSSSASGVWKIVLDKIAEKGFASKSHASGPQMMGLNNLAVVKYIQEMPGAENCTKYVMQKWLDEPKGVPEKDTITNNAVLIPDVNPANNNPITSHEYNSPNKNTHVISEHVTNVKRIKPTSNSPLSNILNDDEYEVMSPHTSIPTKDQNENY